MQVVDRGGKVVHSVIMHATDGEKATSVSQICWDSSGMKLAAIHKGGGTVSIWHSSTGEVMPIGSGLKDLTFLAWSTTDDVLAIGNQKGGLVLYNDMQKKKEKFVGKHYKRICCGFWTADGNLVLGSVDNVITVSNKHGETLNQINCLGEPMEIRMHQVEAGKRTVLDVKSMLSINVGRKSILLADLKKEQPEPMELKFNESYGEIVGHVWTSETNILIGFAAGWAVIISIRKADMSEELFCKQILQYNMSDMSYCASLKQAAFCGMREISSLDIPSFGTNSFIDSTRGLKPEYSSAKWSPDGQVLATWDEASSSMTVFLASLPKLNDCYKGSVAFLSSLQEVTIRMSGSEAEIKGKVQETIHLEIEPAFVSLGSFYLACGMNNQCWYYNYSEKRTPLVSKRDYIGTVDCVKLNGDFAAVLTEGRVHIHPVVEQESVDEESMVPEKGQSADVKCIGLTEEFLIYGTSRGELNYWSMADRTMVNRYRHDSGSVTNVYPNAFGTRVIFVDNRQKMYLLNPTNDQILEIHNDHVALDLECILWDSEDLNVFVVYGSHAFHVYVYAPVTIDGAKINYLEVMQAPRNIVQPIMVRNGVVHMQMGHGSVDTMVLHTHKSIQGDLHGREPTQEKKNLEMQQHRDLLHFDQAARLASGSGNPAAMTELAELALRHLELEAAIVLYRVLGNASMVLTLEQLLNVDDKNLLAGHLVVLLDNDYNAAQELFLRSPTPTAALEMRKDMKQWDEAMELAEQFAPEQLSEISREYGGLLEMRGEYEEARRYFETSLSYPDRDPADDLSCQAGIARTTIQMGDTAQGRRLALEMRNTQLCKECAQILEDMNHLHEAAELYAKSGAYEKAVAIYIQTKAFANAQPLMMKVKSPKLHAQYARAMEAEGNFAEAAAAYEVAKDTDAVVRLNLQKLGNPQKAFALVRRTHTIEGANLVSSFCLERQDYPAAIEFLLCSKKPQEAFEIAQAHRLMDVFVRQLREDGTSADYMKAAKYFEAQGGFDKAADLYHRCGQYSHALKLYLKCGSSKLDDCIAVVGKADNDALTNQLIDFLVGGEDGMAQDHNYLFKLHIALGNYDKAAQTAVVIAKQEQEMGNYKLAHDQLFDTYKELRSQGKRPSTELDRTLMLLHSYILVKSLVKLGDHLGAARMLIRVARNISRFPSHVVPILTSTVIECQRAKLKKTAYEYAAMLVRPEYRDQIAPSYKRKIELIVRKPDREAVEQEEAMVPCLFCGAQGLESELQCHSCKNIVPFCIATGMRMTKADWAQCPTCQLPCRYADFVRIVEADGRCPMCSNDIIVSNVQRGEVPSDLLGLKYSKQGAD